MEPKSRAAELERLGAERWEQQQRAQAAEMQERQRQREEAPTGNHLFWRPNPFSEEKDAHVHPYVRTNEKGQKLTNYRGKQYLIGPDGRFVHADELPGVLEDPELKTRDNQKANQFQPAFNDKGLKYVPVSGYDMFALKPNSQYKYRIPHDSVVNKVGDCKLCLCFGWRLTAAQWIWWLNLLCFIVHTTMVFVTFHYAYWQHKHPNGDVFDLRYDTEHMMVRIYRFTGIPTQAMIDNNETVWSEDEWRNGTFSKTEFYLRDNDLPVNYASLVASFFAISAFFHLWALLMGISEHCWFWYWRQLDDGFAYWRWIEYSASASIMSMTIAIAIGIREQSILAGIFMLHWTTMMHGLLTEYVSVPRSTPDRKTYALPVGAEQFHQWQRLVDPVETEEDGEPPKPSDAARNPRFRVDYHQDPRALKLISQDAWEGDRPYADVEYWNALKKKRGKAGEVFERGNYYIEAQRCLNYMRRMFPHTLGYFPMVAAWVIIIVHLETAKRDLTYITDRTMPEWVNGAVYGTVVIFWSFSVVQIIYQRLAPGFYFGTELTYCALSLTSKLWLGWFILLNVLYNKPEDGGADAALRGANAGDS